MPLVNTWIKNEDWDSYYQLASNKRWGEFIHNALNGSLTWADGDRISGTVLVKAPDVDPKISVGIAQDSSDALNQETLVWGKAREMMKPLADSMRPIKAKEAKKSHPDAADTSLGPRVIKTPEDAVKAVFPNAQKYCPNGHAIPDGRSKCLGKKCKYS